MTKKKNVTNSAEVARAWLSDQRAQYYWGDFYLWTGSIYRPVERGLVEQQVVELIAHELGESEATAPLVREAVDSIAQITHLSADRTPPFWVNTRQSGNDLLIVRNGILDLSPLYEYDDPLLIPHNPDLFATSRTLYDFDQEASCPKFDGFLNWFTCGDEDMAELLLQYMAYILLPSLQLQRFLVLQGDGDNGKFVFLHTVEHLVGPGNYSAVPLERIGSRFSLASIHNRRVNIASDVNDVDKVSEGFLKQYCDGSPLPFERKFRDIVTMVLTARLLFACNWLPRFRDRTRGLWRRLLLMVCNAVVDPDNTVRKLENQFNMSGVLNRVIEAAHRLIELGDFVIPESVQRAVRNEQVDANPARAFIEEHFTLKSGDFAGMMGVYLNYKAWLVNNGFKGCLTLPNFGKEFNACFREEIAEGVVRKGKSKGGSPRINGYYGVEFHLNGIQDDEPIEFQEEFPF